MKDVFARINVAQLKALEIALGKLTGLGVCKLKTKSHKDGIIYVPEVGTFRGGTAGVIGWIFQSIEIECRPLKTEENLLCDVCVQYHHSRVVGGGSNGTRGSLIWQDEEWKIIDSFATKDEDRFRSLDNPLPSFSNASTCRVAAERSS